jgi:hypothetical protein
MSQVRIQFSSIGERWTLERVGTVPAGDLEPIGTTTMVGRDSSGSVVEMVIDEVSPSDEVIRLAVESFGDGVESVLRALPIGEIDVVVGDGLEVAIPTAERSPARRASIQISVMTGEPGIAVPTSDNVYRVVLESSGGPAPAVVERDSDRARIGVSIPVAAAPEGSWVRVADSESGTILAIGELRPESDGENRASMTFSLDVPTQALHFSATDEPLSDPGTRRERRRRWARETELLAQSKRPGQSSEAAELLRRAAEIYEAIDDAASAERCIAQARTLETRRRRRRIAAAIIALLVVGGATGFLVSGFDDGDSGISSNPGPVNLVFDSPSDATNTLGARLMVSGASSFKAGSTLELVVQAKVEMTDAFFYPDAATCRGAVGGNSNGGGDGSMYLPVFAPQFTYLGSDEVGVRVLDPFEVDGQIQVAFMSAEECSRLEDVADPFAVGLNGKALLVPFTHTVELPSDMEAGFWAVTLVSGDEEGQPSRGQPVIIEVVD